MTASIIRDSLTLFLLIYAVIDLGYRIILFVMQAVCKTSDAKDMFCVVDATQMPPESLEYRVRSALMRLEEPIVVLCDALPDESAVILRTLCSEHDALYALGKKELAEWLTSGTSPDVFLSNAKTAAPSHSK